jgi:hypothetical protein
MMFVSPRLIALAALAASLMPSVAAEPIEGGLSLRPDSVPWTRFQGRLSFTTAPSAVPGDMAAGPDAIALRGLSLMGDYYLTGSLLGQRQSGGLRATSALLIGPRGQTLGAGSLGFPNGGRGLSVERRLATPAAEADSSAALAYLGIGYTGLSPAGGWGFSADLGVALTQDQRVRFGGAYTGGPALDDAVRDLRLSPMLQLGVSYSF